MRNCSSRSDEGKPVNVEKPMSAFSRVVTVNPRRLVSLVILVLFLLPSGALAQDLSFATRLAPWPPEGWPEGARGEVRLTTLDDDRHIGVFLPDFRHG